MATSKPDYSKLNPKKELNKDEKKVDVDSAIDSMYNTAQTQRTNEEVQEETRRKKADTEETEKLVRVSVDTPSKMIKLIKRRMLDEDVPTLREYFLGLAKKDLGI